MESLSGGNVSGIWPLTDLWRHFRGPDYRPCYELREKGKVNSEIEDRHWLDELSMHIDHVAHRLEREEGNPYRQRQFQ